MNLLSPAGLSFLLYDWLRVDELCRLDRYSEHGRETFDAVLDLAATIAREHFAPHNRMSDLHEPTFDGQRVQMIPEPRAALDVVARAGLLSAGMDATVGGAQLPQVVAVACFAWFQAANVATWAYASLTIANANLIQRFGTAEQVERFVLPMLDGRFHGTMCLSEPHAGSSLADLTTRAVPQPGGTYRLHGHKMWISGGDHELGENIVHLVLARIPGAGPGVHGLSLFLVPKFLLDDDGKVAERNDVATAGLNHKLGFRGTTNAILNFGEGLHRPGGQPGAIGYLVGNPNEGLSHMFHMMNEARIAVGAQAAALGWTGYLKSLEYARTRHQGSRAGQPVRIVDHPDVRRMLLAQKVYAEGSMALVLYCGRLLDEQLTAADPEQAHDLELLLELLTPVAKSWPSQWCVTANDLAIQVLGGYGYTRDYDVEQHYRDNRLNPIHEGTTGIQALDLLGRKTRLQDGRALDLLGLRIGATLAKARESDDEARGTADVLDDIWQKLRAVTRTIHAADDPGRLANATVYLEAFGHTVIGWIWLELLLACGTGDDALRNGERHAARFFHRYELPRVTAHLDLLARLDRTTVELDPDWL
ncbi:acyl-CoA dehydrogenase [Kribbella sp. NPDC049227]|uniref:acyl-CoA dehydrogenase n=1 Tax=Kribbella sp. NPDC049227 TaxID=3364113 RepID=UPI0037148A30